MALHFINLIDPDTGHTSSLELDDKQPNALRVVGVLHHGCRIKPKTNKDAEMLVDWLFNEVVTPPIPLARIQGAIDKLEHGEATTAIPER